VSPASASPPSPHGYSLELTSDEVTALARYMGACTARTAQMRHNVDRYEAEWLAALVRYACREVSGRCLKAGEG
jgi:hypothetical protein